MKSLKRSFIIIAAGVVTVFAAGAAVLSNAAPAQAATTTVSPQVAADLQYLREEEKLARDVYRVFAAQYGSQVKIFANIASSENTHMTAVKRLLTTYKIADPVKTDVPGVFQNQELQELYAQLVAQGSQSLQDALQVGITIETLDISDIQLLRTHTTIKSITTVYKNLLNGSYNHLAAFERTLAAYSN